MGSPHPHSPSPVMSPSHHPAQQQQHQQQHTSTIKKESLDALQLHQHRNPNLRVIVTQSQVLQNGRTDDQQAIPTNTNNGNYNTLNNFNGSNNTNSLDLAGDLTTHTNLQSAWSQQQQQPQQLRQLDLGNIPQGTPQNCINAQTIPQLSISTSTPPPPQCS